MLFNWGRKGKGGKRKTPELFLFLFVHTYYYNKSYLLTIKLRRMGEGMAPSSARCSSSPRLSSSTIGEYCFRPFSEFSFITVYSGCTWHQSAPEGAVTFFSSHTGKHSLFFCVFHFRSQTWSNKKRIFIFLTQGKTSTYSREKHNKSPFFFTKKNPQFSLEKARCS